MNLSSSKWRRNWYPGAWKKISKKCDPGVVNILVKLNQQAQKHLREEPMRDNDGHEDQIREQLPDVGDVDPDLLDVHNGGIHLGFLLII